MLEFVLQREGGYVNDPNDLGGETNKGITYRTYNEYRKTKGLKPQSVKNITDAEVKEIYYNNYYKASGADKISDPVLSSYVFDTAVNMGVSRAKSFLNQSNGDVSKYEQLRREKYIEFTQARPSQKIYLQGWNNRVNELKNFTQINFPQKDIPTVQKENKAQLFTLRAEKYAINTQSINDKFNQEIRNKYEIIKNNKLKNLFGRKFSNSSSKQSSNNIGSHWVTINGNHVYL